MIFLYVPILSHYRLEVYRRLSKRLKGDFVYIYGEITNMTSEFLGDTKVLPFQSFKLKNYWVGKKFAVWQHLLKPFKIYGLPEVAILPESARMLFIFPLIIFFRLKKIPIIFWGHGGNRRRDVVESHSLRDILHRFLIRRYCDAYICYTAIRKKKLSYITDVKKLFVAKNTLDTASLFHLRKDLELKGKEKARKELGLKKKNYICFIGRLIEDKNPNLILDVLKLLQDKGENIGAIIIGDGPLMKELKEKTNILELEGVYFTGMIAKWEDSAPYIFAGDILLNPGCLGLSVNHAFSFGLPVVTQKTGEEGPYHGPERVYIKEGFNGSFVENGNVEAMANKILEILKDHRRWSENAIEYAENELKIENMVNGILKAINYVKKIY